MRAGLVAAVSGVEFHVLVVHAAMVFHPMGPFHMGRELICYVMIPEIVICLEFDNLESSLPPSTLLHVSCWCTLVLALALAGGVSMGKAMRRLVCKALRIF